MKIKLLLISFILAANALGAVAQVSKTYFVSKPGTLISMMTEDEANSITHLTLTGKINAEDFRHLRDEFPNLKLKGLPIWACILLFIVVFFVFMLLYSALIQGFLSLVLGVEARHPGIVGYILQETGMFLAALTSAVIMLRFERRPFSDLGLSVKGHARGLWYGLLIAVLFYLVGFGLSLLLGEIEVTGFKFESVNLLGSWGFTHFVAQHRSLNPVPKKMKGDRETKILCIVRSYQIRIP